MLAGYSSSEDDEDPNRKYSAVSLKNPSVQSSLSQPVSSSIKTSLFTELPHAQETPTPKKKKMKKKSIFKLPLLEEPASIDSGSDSAEELPALSTKIDERLVWDEADMSIQEGPIQHLNYVLPLPVEEYFEKEEQEESVKESGRSSDKKLERILESGGDISNLGFQQVDSAEIFTRAKEIRDAKLQSGISFSNNVIPQSMKLKNQLTAMAAQAQAMEPQLKEEWARGKRVRQETKGKYGW